MEEKYIETAKRILTIVQKEVGFLGQQTYSHKWITKVAKLLKSLDIKYPIDFLNKEVYEAISVGDDEKTIELIGHEVFRSKDYIKLNDLLDEFSDLV